MVWFLGALLASAGLILLIQFLFPGTLSHSDDKMRFAYAITLLALVGSSLFLGFRANLRETAQSMIIWIAIGLGLVTVYTYRDALKAMPSEVMGSIVPGAPQEQGKDVKIRVSTGGHFFTYAGVNDGRVRFLVDTGATEVALTRADAKRAGFDLNKIQYTERVRTASGIARAAPIRIKEIRVGSITIRNVHGHVGDTGMEQSLLGMSFLNRLSSYEFSNRELVLRQD